MKETLPKLKAKLQLIFNEFIRLRDKHEPCISCGEYKKLQCGHYYPVKGYDGLRFDEFNAHGECSGCNCFDESHLIRYGDNLRLRIGERRLFLLKERAEEYKKNGYKWSRSELKELITIYRLKLKELKNE